MTVRSILIILAFGAFLSTAATGFIFFHSQRMVRFQEIEREVVAEASGLQNHISTILRKNTQNVRALAGLRELADLLTAPGGTSRAQAEYVLKLFKESFGTTTCALLDGQGWLRASSDPSENENRFQKRSFADRADFQKNMAGIPTVSLSLGSVSGKRGLFYSHPVRRPGTDEVIGVAVIKADLARLEIKFRQHPESIVMLAGPHGLVFASNRQDWQWHLLGAGSEDIDKALIATRLFGSGPWPALNFSGLGPNRMVDPAGKEYLAEKLALDFLPGWSLVFLRRADWFADGPGRTGFQNKDYVILVLVGFSGLAILLLYKAASLDIRQKKTYESALEESEEKFRSIVENSHEGILIVGRGFRFDYANEETALILGYPVNELKGMDFRKILHPESLPLVSRYYEARISGKTPPRRYELNTVRPNGEIRCLEMSASAIKDSKGEVRTLGLVLDITERKKAETALRESEHKYRTILDTMEEGYFEVDLEGRLTFVNQSMGRILEYSQEELIGLDHRKLGVPEDYGKIQEVVQEIQETGGPIPGVEFEVLSKTGIRKILEISVSLSRNQEGDHVGFHGVAREVTHRRKAEEALRESEERYRTVLEGNPDPLVVLDTGGRVVYLNKAFSDVFGWSLEEREGDTLEAMVPDGFWEESRKIFQKVMAGDSVSGIETWRYTKSGQMIPVSISASVYLDREKNPRGGVLNIRDIRVQKNLEHQLHQAQKMEALGTLASGVAHDFNNLLQALSGYLQLLSSEIKLEPGIEKYLKGAEYAVQRARDLVWRMMTFSRKVKPELQNISLVLVITQAIEIMERVIPKMIQVEVEVSEELWGIKGDAGQLEQVMINLGTNAQDAMPEGGILSFRGENVILDEAFCAERVGLEPGPYVFLTVSDTGKGMDEETLKHIFEPFFTTKAVGKGTGLGLSTVYGIVRSHNGVIQCRSSPGAGTVFEIMFPALGRSVLEEKVGESTETEGLFGRETVLLVDDEEAIREIAQEALGKFGYRTLEADSGEMAVELYRREKEGIDLVVLDLGMPGMGGHACIRELKEIDPQVRVIIASGYSEEDPKHDPAKANASGYLRKPYRLVELLRAIRRLMDG